jgi:hypothetical protein
MTVTMKKEAVRGRTKTLAEIKYKACAISKLPKPGASVLIKYFIFH